MKSMNKEKVVEFGSAGLKAIDDETGLGRSIVHNFLINKFQDRVDLNSFIACLRAGMRDKLGDGVN